jgi:titin
MMAYVLYKVYGSSATSTKDIVFNLQDAYGMLRSEDYADAIMSAFNNSELETTNPGNEKGAIDAMFRDLLSADSLRFFDANGTQVPGIYEVSSDLSGSGTWNLVDGDTIEIRTIFTFTNSVTLRTSIDVAQNLNPLPTQSNGETVCIPAGTKLALRLQLVASDEGVSAPPIGNLSAAPTPPTSLALTPGNNSIFVSWDVPVSDGNSVITAYNLYLDGVKITSMYGVFYTIRGLSNGGTYYVSITAVNPNGESALSTASVTLPTLVARPGAPTNLALASGDGSLVASWEAPVSNGGAPVIAYTVYNGDVAVGFTTNLSYTITGLTNGSSYRISVTATNTSGEGVKCSIVSGTPRIPPPRPASQVPTAPTSLSLVAGNGSIAASWGLPVSNGAETISSYNVYRDGVLIASPLTTSYNLTGLQNGRSYAVVVTAVNLVGEGPASSPQSATPVSPPLPVFTAPDAPTNLQLIPGNGTISASWSAPVNDGGLPITAYRLFIDNNIIPFNSTSTSYTFSALMNGYNYMISVSAVNSINVGAPSIPVSATPFAPPPSLTTPTAPTSLSLIATDAAIAVSWSLPVSNGGAAITNYKVYNYGALVGSTPNTSYNMTGLLNGTNYSITVTAENSEGEGVPSAAQQATPTAPSPPPPPSVTVPGAPTNLQLSAGDGSVTVSWSAPANNGGAGVVSYTIYNNGNEVGNSVLTPYTISGLQNGTSYSISVTATNSEGEGLPCAAQQATPVAPSAPGAPLALSVIPGDTTAALSWSAPASNGGSPITRYNVYNNGNLIAFSEGLSYSIESLTNGINYNVLVKAVNLVGEGAASNRVYYIPFSTADGGAVPSEPLNLAAAPGDGSVAVSWDPPSESGSGGVIVSYNIYLNDVIYANIDGTLSTYTISPLTNDISYNIKMSSLNMAGESVLTSQVSVVPASGSPM